MELLYNGVNILGNRNIKLSSCIAIDNVNGEADTLRMSFEDFSGLWNAWQPRFGDVVEAKKDGWSTGKMYIDIIEENEKAYILESKSTPPKSRQAGSTVWENVRFSKIASDLAQFSSLELVLYDITDYEYVRFERKQESPIKALGRLCMLEGYVLKVTDGKAVIFDEKTYENYAPVEDLNPNDYLYSDKDVGRSSVNIQWFNGELIQGACSDVNIFAETENVIDVPVYNVAQAQRWSKGLLRWFNKSRHIAKTSIDQNLGLSAASVIGLPRGNYYIAKLQHDLIGSKSHLYLRKPIEGDY